jgi:aryl-alcohol dehydrogenase-like predicted oxidoreductase
MFAWQFEKALHVAEKSGWTRFVTMQNHLNLLHREEEREMLPLCADAGIGVIPWSPLARGRLTRDWNESTERHNTDGFGNSLYDKTADADRRVIEAVAKIAAARGIPRAQVALAWVIGKAEVSAPIVGASKPRHLDDAIAALHVNLTADEVESLEAPYTPHDVVGSVRGPVVRVSLAGGRRVAREPSDVNRAGSMSLN